MSTSGASGSDRPAAEPEPGRAADPLDRTGAPGPAVDGTRRSPADEPSGFTSMAEQLLRLKRELLATQSRLEQQGTQLSLALSLPRFFVRDRPEQ